MNALLYQSAAMICAAAALTQARSIHALGDSALPALVSPEPLVLPGPLVHVSARERVRPRRASE